MVQQRYVICLMIVFVITVSLSSRICFSMILTQMVFIPNLNQTKNPNHEIICPANMIHETSKDNNQTSTILNINDERFQWSQELQGIILSSFNWGYAIAMFSSGMLVQKYGAKSVLSVGLFISAIIIILTPLAVTFGDVYLLTIARASTGLFQAPLFPCCAAFKIAWFPVEQRGRFSALIAIGMSIGGIFIVYCTGILMSFAGRWDLAFYFHGAITMLCCILMPFLCYDRPHSHPYITEKEKRFLAQEINYLHNEDNLATPWRKVLTNTPVITLIIVSSIASLSSNVIYYDLSKYMNDVLHLSIKRNTQYLSIPLFSNLFFAIFVGFTNDMMLKKRVVSLTKIRKICVALSSMLPGIFLVAASYAECDETQVVIYFVLAHAFDGINISGTWPNVLDLAPNYVGPITGLSNTFQIFSSIIAHYIIGILTPNAYLSEWRFVFWLTFGSCIARTIIFTLFGSAKIQPWNALNKNEDKGKEDVLLP